MRVDEITTAAELEKLKHPWQELWAKCTYATPFQSPAWLIPWWNSFHPGDLIVLAFRDNEQLIAIAPMFLLKGTIRLLGAGNTDYLDMLCESRCIDPVTRLLSEYLSDRQSEWDFCDFMDLPSWSPLLSADTSALFERPASECSVCPVLILNQLSVSKKLMSNLQSAEHHLGQDGGFYFEEADNASTLDMIDALIHLHEMRWKMKGDAGVFRSEDVRRFHRSAAPALSRTRLLRLYGLRHQGRFIAIHYNLCGHGRTYYYLGGFDPSMASYSPGNLIVHYSIKKAIESGDVEYDFLRGREANKYRWGAQDRRTFRLRCHSHALAAF